MNFRLFTPVMLTMALLSCKPSVVEEQHDGEEEHKIFYTAYSEKFELFAEADPLVAGSPARVITYFTRLADFKPLEGGSVTIDLNINGQHVSQTISETEKKGIYGFEILPGISGVGTLEYTLETAEGRYQIVVPGISVFQTEEEAHEAAESLEIQSVNAAVFTKEQSWKTDFSTDYPTLEAFGQVIRATGQVQTAGSDEVDVTARAGGIVLFEEENIVEGTITARGKKLLSIRGGGIADNNSEVHFAETRNNYDKAKSDYERALLLSEQNIIAQKELLAYRREFENSRAHFENLSSNFSESGQIIKSPLDGSVTRLYVKNGQYVEAGDPLLTISRNKKLLIKAELGQRYAAHISEFSDANILNRADGRMYPLKDLGGRLLAVGKTTTADNYLIPLTLEISNNGSFIPGTFVDVFIKSTSSSDLLTLPVSALLEEQGSFFVFIQLTPELFEKREVKPGVSDGIRTEIKAGLSSADRVITRGAIIVKLAQAAGKLDPHAGHVH